MQEVGPRSPTSTFPWRLSAQLQLLQQLLIPPCASPLIVFPAFRDACAGHVARTLACAYPVKGNCAHTLQGEQVPGQFSEALPNRCLPAALPPDTSYPATLREPLRKQWFLSKVKKFSAAAQSWNETTPVHALASDQSEREDTQERCRSSPKNRSPSLRATARDALLSHDVEYSGSPPSSLTPRAQAATTRGASPLPR